MRKTATADSDVQTDPSETGAITSSAGASSCCTSEVGTEAAECCAAVEGDNASTFAATVKQNLLITESSCRKRWMLWDQPKRTWQASAYYHPWTHLTGRDPDKYTRPNRTFQAQHN